MWRLNKMISKYTTGSRIHQALARIYQSRITAQELRKEIGYTESILRLEEFIISPLLNDGFISRSNGDVFYPYLSITPRGEEKYLSMGAVKSRKPRVERINRMLGTYDGAELRPFTGRPGAMDHEKYPSLMAEGRVYRRSR